MPGPPFGSASAYTDSFPSPPPRQVTISSETCFNLSVFRDMVKQYRKLDDQIITRLNRAQAQLRDQSRIASSSSSRHTPSAPMSDAEAMCLRIWAEIMAGWAHRQTMLTFCTQTVKASVEAKRPHGMTVSDERLAGTPPETLGLGRQGRGWKEDEVLANQLGNEESVEAIIRKRSLDAFKSRCPFFAPQASETVSRTWWDLADSGRAGRGPNIP